MEQGKKKPTIKKKTTFSPQQSSNESQNKPKGKRQSEDAVDQRGKNRGKDDSEMQEDEIEYEDHFEDEFEEEEQAQKEMGEEEDEEGLELEGMTDADWEKLHQLQLNDGEAEAAEEGDDVAVWRPDKGILSPGETLDFENSAYEMLHRMTVEWPCLSFDIVPDTLGNNRTKFPMTSYIITGSQGDGKEGNNLMAIKMSQLHKTKYDDASDNERSDSDDEGLDDEAEMEFKSAAHPAPVNRLRMIRGVENPRIVGAWGADGVVYVWDVSTLVKALDGPLVNNNITSNANSNDNGNNNNSNNSSAGLLAKLTRHVDEGFAMDWSGLKGGRLLTGDCKGQIFLTEQTNSSFAQQDTPFLSHKLSVEDLQWSPTEVDVFASCSVDKTIKIWDARMKKSAALSYLAADCDVNVISWNHKVPYLMLSGADDGSFHVWDLRSLKPNQCTSIGHFKWHSDSITSVEWDPNDESVLAVAGADDQITVWDLSLERDTETDGTGEDEYPPQLLFCHQGQTEIKELHWHPQLPGVLISTAANGFNIFKPAIDIQEEDPEDILEER